MQTWHHFDGSLPGEQITVSISVVFQLSNVPIVARRLIEETIHKLHYDLIWFSNDLEIMLVMALLLGEVLLYQRFRWLCDTLLCSCSSSL